MHGAGGSQHWYEAWPLTCIQAQQRKPETVDHFVAPKKVTQGKSLVVPDINLHSSFSPEAPKTKYTVAVFRPHKNMTSLVPQALYSEGDLSRQHTLLEKIPLCRVNHSTSTCTLCLESFSKPAWRQTSHINNPKTIKTKQQQKGSHNPYRGIDWAPNSNDQGECHTNP